MHAGVVGHVGAQQVLSSRPPVPQEHSRACGGAKEDEVSQVPAEIDDDIIFFPANPGNDF